MASVLSFGALTGVESFSKTIVFRGWCVTTHAGTARGGFKVDSALFCGSFKLHIFRYAKK